jgi:hypothetical protein
MALSYGEQLHDSRWLKKCAEIKERDDYKCRICKDHEHYLDVHHICYFPDILLWEYDNELLITICRKHHKILNFELPKLAGLIAFRILTNDIDPMNIEWFLNLLKDLDKNIYGQNQNDKTGILESSDFSKTR